MHVRQLGDSIDQLNGSSEQRGSLASDMWSAHGKQDGLECRGEGTVGSV